MAQSKITLIGMNNYLYSDNIDLFQNISLPTGIDRDLAINTILMRGGEFEVLYADPNFMINMIKIWNDKWYRTFEKWYTALNIDYDPLNNYDRTETYTDTRTEKEDITKTEDVKANDTSTSTGTSDINNLKSAYDANSYVPHDNSNSSTKGGNTSTSNTDVDGKQNRDLSGTVKHNAHLFGNIGVTTSQQMLEAELNINKWNLYDHIADIFLAELCIYVY